MTQTQLSLPRVACGVDMVDLTTFERLLEHGGSRFLERIYTPGEIAHCAGRVPQLATRIAAKEAVSKALGTGIRGVAWTDIEVVTSDTGQPAVHLHGQAARRADALALHDWSLSLVHEGGYAIAFAVATARSTLEESHDEPS